MQITVFNRGQNTLHRSQLISDEKFFFPQKGIYERYLNKYCLNFDIAIDRAMIDF